MPTQQLPKDPSLENLRKQAKSLRNSVLSSNPTALARLREFHPHPDEATASFSLSDAQLVVARSYGFASWPRLKQYVEVVTRHSFLPPQANEEDESEAAPDRFMRLACLNYTSDHAQRRAQARELFAQDPSIAQTNIFTAATAGDVQTARNLLQADPSLVNARGGPYNWEPLLYAAYSRLNHKDYSTLEVARLLLESGADSNAGFLWDGFYLFTALTGAFGEGESGPVHQPEHQYCYQLARLLLEAGADPNDGQTLYNRMFTGGTKHLELLFEFGLGQSSEGVWFQRLGDRLGSAAEMLQQQVGWAAKYNQLERMKLLVDHGVDINGVDTRLRRTAYELAVLHGNQEIAEFLLAHGATRKQFAEVDDFASACLAGDAERARSLLSRSPHLLTQLGHRETELLQLAAESDKRDAIRLMVELGFDLNRVQRTTPLHHAAMTGRLEMAKLLIELGADPLIKDTEFNARPIGWAKYGEKTEVADFLEQFEPD
jgi:ankyrin repeat protein